MGWFTEPISEQEKQQIMADIQETKNKLDALTTELNTLIARLKAALEL